MAGKGRRTAARQSELSRRRKKTQRSPSGIPATVSLPSQQSGGGAAVAVEAAADDATPVNTGQQTSPSAAAPAARPAPRSAAQPRGQGRLRGDRPAAYNYVGAELRRIALLSTAVLAALVVLSVVL